MMSANNPPGKPASTKEENLNGSNRKTGSTRPQEQVQKCPRCDSPNTKFCYYNNYSLTQPRHFCKTCRRYWTKGGALRNVPIGGGCRKNKKMKSSSRFSADSKDSTSSSEMGGLNFFHGFSPAMDFQLGGLSLPRLNPSPVGNIYNQFASFVDTTATSFNLDPSGSGTSTSLMGFTNYPLSSASTALDGGAIQLQENMGSMNVNNGLASSIESLSSINQDLHWKLQQQRFATLFGDDHHKENNTTVPSVSLENQALKPQPILFQNLEASKPEFSAVGIPRKGTNNETTTEWFFGNSYAPITPTPTSSGNGNDNTSNWDGVQAWNDLHQCNTLP